MHTTTPTAPIRNRFVFAGLLLIVLLLGLASRSAAAKALPEVVRDYSGDILWALMVYLMFAVLLPKATANRVTLLAMMFATSIEVSQLFHPDWLEYIRNLPGMRLVFGYSFLFSDLLCYATGIAIGWLSEITWRKIRSRK